MLKFYQQLACILVISCLACSQLEDDSEPNIYSEERS